jgi:hypothetical protein
MAMRFTVLVSLARYGWPFAHGYEPMSWRGLTAGNQCLSGHKRTLSSSLATQSMATNTVAAQPADAAERSLQGMDEPSRLIEKQKVRALQLWDERCSEGALDPGRFVKSIHVQKLDESVKHDLAHGVVPPIFHAVVSKGTPLFSTAIHKLSSDPVSAGTAIENRKAPLLSSLSNPYNVLFTGNPPAANSRVLDAACPGAWEFDTKSTDSVAQLINTKAVMLGADVECTDGLKSVLFEDPSAQSFSLLTRPLSRGVVANCFDSSKRASSLAITGSEGIGKSWTLLYALQQALLYENAIVVFMLRKEGVAFLCSRVNGKVFVWIAHADSKVSLFGREDVLVLYDPNEATRGGADFPRGARMLIYAAYNDHAYFTNGIYKVQVKPERFLGLWTKDELAAALSRFNPALSLKTALARASNVGLIPRYIMNNAFYQRRENELHAVLDAIKRHPAAREKLLDFDGKETNVGVPLSTVFAVGAALMDSDEYDEESNEAEDVAAGDLGNGDAPDDVAGGKISDKVLPDVGYEGQYVHYTERAISFMTEFPSSITTSLIASLQTSENLRLWGKMSREGSHEKCDSRSHVELRSQPVFYVQTSSLVASDGAGYWTRKCSGVEVLLH